MKISNHKTKTAGYYDFQETRDKLYAESKIFINLMEIILSEQNIKLAYRNVKSNTGSQTAGTDGKTIKFFSNMDEKTYAEFIRNKLKRYYPKQVKRVEIPKPNGKEPLGIPCIREGTE